MKWFWLIFGSAVAVGVGAALAQGASATSVDPYLIVPWHQIGQARLGMSRSTLHRLYGYGGPTDQEDAVYTLPGAGGSLSVGFAGTPQQAVDFVTGSPNVHTRDGIRIGSRIPLGPCHRLRNGVCQHRWRGLVYHHVDRRGTSAQWLGSFCDRGIYEVVRLGYTHGVIDYFSMWYDAGICGRRTPRSPLTAADRAGIRAVLPQTVNGKPIEVSRFRVSIDTKEWVSVWLGGKGSAARHIQSAFVVLHHQKGKWVVVDLGTRMVGCRDVPIKPLTQIGGGCGPDSGAP